MALETLIEFIFNNIFFVFIIIGGIISFLKRLKEANNQPAKPVQRPSVREEKRETPFQKEENSDLSSMETIQVENTRLQTTNLQNEKERLYHFKEQVGEVSSIKLKDQSLNKSGMKKKTFKNPSKNKLREGLIWAEILSAPRAHKPYGRESFRRTKG